MGVTGPLIFLLLGLPTPALAVLRAFHFVNLPKTWTEAQSYCRERFDDLVTIETEDDWARVSQIVVNSGQPAAWIGLYDDVKSWRWSLDNTSLYDRDYGSWFTFLEDNVGGVEKCGTIYQGTMYDTDCDISERMTMCYDEISDSFIKYSTPSDWLTAQSYCRATYTDLAIIRNQQDWNTVMGLVSSSGWGHWVGLSREGWKWSDLRSSSFRVWGAGQPSGGNDACVAAFENEWSDGPCNLEFPFICSGPPRWVKVMKVKLQTDGLVNLNDPLVQEAVLKQMKGDVRQGVHQEFNMRWRKQPHGDVFNKTEL